MPLLFLFLFLFLSVSLRHPVSHLPGSSLVCAPDRFLWFLLYLLSLAFCILYCLDAFCFPSASLCLAFVSLFCLNTNMLKLFWKITFTKKCELIHNKTADWHAPVLSIVGVILTLLHWQSIEVVDLMPYWCPDYFSTCSNCNSSLHNEHSDFCFIQKKYALQNVFITFYRFL